MYGRWLIEGAPRVVLIDTKSAYRFMDEWKADLWNTAGIPSPPGDEETNEAVVFGYLVAWFLGEVGIATGLEILLTLYSMLQMTRLTQSLRISTSGLQVLLYHCARSAELMSPPSSPLMQLSSADIFARAPSISTTTSNTLMWMPRLESAEFTTDTVSKEPRRMPATSSQPCLTSPPTNLSTFSSASLMECCPTVST